MNKLFKLLTVAMFIIVSGCSSDEPETENQTDPIIGVWYSWSDSGEEYSDCQKNSTLTFSSNGELIYKEFSENATNNCVLSSEEMGTWLNETENKYKLTINGIPHTFYINFSNNNTIFKLYSDENDTQNYDEYRK